MIRTNDSNTNKIIKLDERNFVEKPLLEQLEKLGWRVLDLKMTDTPDKSFRTHFREVVIESELRQALTDLNPFLEEDQINELIERMTNIQGSGLLENNRAVFDLLLSHPTVSQNRKTLEDSPTVQYIDFKNWQNNRFLAVCQFKVAIPGTEHHFIPDVVLFVNGLPLVVIEAKSPKVNDAMGEAIDQLMRYSGQRGETGEGNAALFWYNQFLVVSCRNAAKFGTITTQIEKHYYRWTDPYPLTLADLEHGQHSTPTDQQRLIAGMCSPAHLLALLRSFTVFRTEEGGKTEKVVARHQQFRAVEKALVRLRTGLTPKERGGIIWHTQGSGKSLTMLFLVRRMRFLDEFAPWKIIFITDRTDLEGQLSSTAAAIGQSVKVAENIAQLKEFVKNPVPDLVMGMIHKFQERDLSAVFPILNDSPFVLTLTDEAHRTQYGLLGANFDRAVPNAARIAYTGTPIDKTEESFGDYIDKYTMRESIEDGTTLEIVYEGRTHNAEVPDKAGMDSLFEDVFSDYNLSERLHILGYGSRDAYLEAESTIKAKAKDMIEHYVEGIFTRGFKGQVVASSQEAVVRYKKHLEAAIQEKIIALEQDNPNKVDLEKLKQLEVGVVISGVDRNEKPHLKAFGNKSDHETTIQRFKLGFKETSGDGAQQVNGFVGLLVVHNMLITGFDAPIEQVLYLDRVMRDHTLLQAIARVNRVYDEFKSVGYIMDYVGIGHHLKKALDHYAEKEAQEILDQISDTATLVAELKQAHEKVWTVLREGGIADFSDIDAFFDLFYDEDIRFKYILAFRELSSAFDNLLPRKEALEFLSDYLNFVAVNQQASRHMNDSRLSMRGIPDKLRAIADAHLVSQGIEVKIKAISILDDDFLKGVNKRNRTKTKAAQVEHAVRHFIDTNFDDDPELFTSFAAQLEQILANFKNNWDAIYRELEKLRERIKAKEREETYGLDRKKEMPIFRILKNELLGEGEIDADTISKFVVLTQEAFAVIERELHTTGFWNSPTMQSRLKGELQNEVLLNHKSIFPALFGKRNQIISRLMEWAKDKHRTILE
jgi:type I restriction enzyme, R subunit